jgi:uncharacterized protein (DUF2147 family)
MRLFKHILGLSLLIITGIISISGIHVEESDLIVGIWEPSDGKARIKIEKIGSKYYGRVVWLKVPNNPNTSKPKTDMNNPDTSMRNAPIKGLRILKDFTYKGNKEWGGGTIYDPKNGKTYSCVIYLKDENTLNIRGYIGVKALGRTDTWKKYTGK